MRFIEQFFFGEARIRPLSEEEISCDVFYVGRDKGRLAQLLSYEKRLQQLGLRTDFHVVANRNHFVLRNRDVLKPAIPYEQVLTRIGQSHAIFDFYEDPEMGLSLRPFEALLYGKKLITNNRNLLNCDFYHKNNVFILGVDDWSELPDFMKRPLADVSSFVGEYSFAAWYAQFEK